MRRLVLVLAVLFAVFHLDDAEGRRRRSSGPRVRRQGLPRRSAPRFRGQQAFAPAVQAGQGQGGLGNIQLDPNGFTGPIGGFNGGIHGGSLGSQFPGIDGTGRPIDDSFRQQDPNGNGNLSTGVSPESEFRISFGNVSRCIANLTNRLENSCTAVIPAACAPRTSFGGFFSTDIMGSRQVLRFDPIGTLFVEVEFACFRNERFPIAQERTATFRRLAGDPRAPTLDQ